MKFKYYDKFIHCDENEFRAYVHPAYNYLKMRQGINILEREAGLLNDISDIFENKTNLFVKDITHSGFLLTRCFSSFKNVTLGTIPNENVLKNIKEWKITNISDISNDIPTIVYCYDLNPDFFEKEYIIFTNKDNEQINYKSYKLCNSDMILHIPNKYHTIIFDELIKYYYENGIFNYDNLIHFTMIIKNGGNTLEKVLTQNLPFMDKWTILDTGSTDGTQDVIRRVLKNKKGKLYEEPFINFRESRNNCLELAGKTCTFNLMLDDTYVIRGDLRKFLNQVRDDIQATSYSLIVKSDDMEYASNRITKSHANLRYIYTIHEVIQKANNINVIIPYEDAGIDDIQDPYMQQRTMNRKLFDIQLLNEMVEEEPHNPRHLYYLAQTYTVLNDKEKAAEYFLKRINHYRDGFMQEKVDACFELARLYNFHLNRPWEECEKYYMMAYELEKRRPDSFYFIGIHYLDIDKKKAFDYFKKAFEIGYPIDLQYSLKPTLSFHFLPRFLTQLCYEFEDYKLGEKSAKLFLDKNPPTAEYYNVIKDWYNIFVCLNQLELKPPKSASKIICFIADGGFSNWTGKDILTNGVGGSETYIIEMARYMKKHTDYQVYVFCKCDKIEDFEGVTYVPLNNVFKFLSENYIQHCIISRFSEYIPCAIKSYVENIYFVLHDIGPSGCVIPDHPKLKKMICLSEWHKQFFLSNFPTLVDKTIVFHHGIDFTHFNENTTKVPYRFIYSSFPNRGLLQLLEMWPRIVSRFSKAELYIYSDVNGKWANDNFPDEMEKIRYLLATTKNIVYNGWVKKEELANGWKSASIWFYPCKFTETFCLTALECAITKTLAITNGLAGLEDTVGDRGITIQGDVTTQEWQDRAYEQIVDILSKPEKMNDLIERNYQWAKNMSWENKAIEFYQTIMKPNILEYKESYNWTNDIKQEYFSNLSLLKSGSILEIGVWTGIRLIEIIKYLEPTKITVIDEWKNYMDKEKMIYVEELGVEKSFYKNIKGYNVNTLKGKPVEKLFELYDKKEQFNFIHLNVKYDSILTLLSWKLLKRGGILAIENFDAELNKFINENKDNIVILPSKGMLFLAKK